MKVLSIKNFTARNTTEYPSAVIVLNYFTKHERSTQTLDVSKTEFKAMGPSSTQLHCRFTVYKDVAALESGADPIETILIDNPHYEEGKSLAHIQPRIDLISFEQPKILSNSELIESAYKKAQELLSLEGELIELS
ncbi:hypothetical protein [Pseudoalteromonas galatheae]|uniref:hypothetical protein n=1 Tax=Pseudoalteromonas galatheae TaxID=579562 RepID=UPI0030CF5366